MIGDALRDPERDGRGQAGRRDGGEQPRGPRRSAIPAGPLPGRPRPPRAAAGAVRLVASQLRELSDP